MAKHTHTGHCQACGRMQAVRFSGKKQGNIAKHGYKVAGFGYFQGTCQGSDRLPLEIDRSYADATIVYMGQYSTRMDIARDEYATGKQLPITVTTSEWIAAKYSGGWRNRLPLPGTGCYKEIPYAEGTTEQQAKAVSKSVGQCVEQARNARMHIDFLKELIVSIHGKALVPIEPPKELAIGDKFCISGTGEYVVLNFQFRKAGGFSGREYKNVVYINGMGVKCYELMRNVTKL